MIVEIDEPYADPPRSTGPLTAPGDAPILDLEDRWGAIDDADLRGGIDVSACERLEIRGSTLTGVTFAADTELQLDVAETAFVDCDLSALRFAKVTNSSFVGCKLQGTDFTSAVLRDVRVERSVLRLSTVRMAELERVAFVDSTIEEVDGYEARLSHVAFPDSALRAVEFDKASFFRVDLRGATELDIRKCRRFDGCLITDDQVLALAYVLAQASGISIDRPELDDA